MCVGGGWQGEAGSCLADCLSDVSSRAGQLTAVLLLRRVLHWKQLGWRVIP